MYETDRGKHIKLKNQSGQELPILLRRCREGDEEKMIACIREEYKDTYFKRKFYDPEYLREEAKNGHIMFLTAQALSEDEMAGMMILKRFFPEEKMCEIASQIFRKKYRGYGLAGAFFDYGLDILKTGNYSAAYCLPVLFHDVTQRLLYRRGLRATGFVLNVFDVVHMIHSYRTGRNEKHSQGIQIMALGKKNAGTVYIPEEHREICGEIYKSLGVDFHISCERRERIPKKSIVRCGYDEEQKSLEIRADAAGEDFGVKMREIHARYPLSGRRTSNVFLNCNNSSALYACEVLQNMGYFFTGLKPLCSEREYMVLHHSGQVKIYFEDYAVSGEFRKMLDYVQGCLAHR